jgi:hypothetical protein
VTAGDCNNDRESIYKRKTSKSMDLNDLKVVVLVGQRDGRMLSIHLIAEWSEIFRPKLSST